MQTPKDSTRKSILQAAQEEFLRVGFEKSSMRRISKKANVSTSNIYNYFQNKEDLLKVLVEPAIKGTELGISLISSDDYLEQRLQFTYETLKRRFNVVLDYVDENRDLFDLLLFKSSGSIYENFLTEVLERVTELNMKQVDYFKKTHNMESLETHVFFVKNLIAFFMNIFVEMVKNKISKEDMFKIEDNFLKFLHFGSKAILLDQKD
ncbi:TetR/AcrR family transcriptional regulator [Leptospira sp. GIMC2001]|uniref:TetR/AcrR family transcriptional regulator n=1 Tax=Leptospira sp. GIMC2001 TaxID=1513297 RepID=UPI00234AFC31|nr:TetR/AcrR family transcriptional regulator [Leptospira sp. GIMC2001]WCL50381.1 TetR/AcrR family transcriptional regulator [Leptospira sp. GIMC2001]